MKNGHNKSERDKQIQPPIFKATFPSLDSLFSFALDRLYSNGNRKNIIFDDRIIKSVQMKHDDIDRRGLDNTKLKV